MPDTAIYAELNIDPFRRAGLVVLEVDRTRIGGEVAIGNSSSPFSELHGNRSDRPGRNSRMLMSADIVSAYRNGISEEVPCAWRTSRNTGTWTDPGIDRWRSGLKCPLRCRFADAMITQAVHQRILVVNPMWLWRRISHEAARCVVPKVVIPSPREE